MPSELAQDAIDLLEPSVGKFMAQGIVDSACEEIGTDMDALGDGDLDDFLEELESRVEIKLGPETAESVRDDLSG